MSKDTWFIEYCGGQYEIAFDGSRGERGPSWYVARSNDGAQSKSFYSWPEGAFSALSWGRINWVK